MIASIPRLLRSSFDFIFPSAERDPGFRVEIERLSIRSLWAIGWINVIMPAVGFVFHSVALYVEPAAPRGMWPLALFPLLGLTAMGLTFWPWGRRNARLLALLWGLASGTALTWSEFYPPHQPDIAQIASTLDVVVVLLVGIATVPAMPWQILLLAIGLNTSNYLLAQLAVRWELIPPLSLHHYAGLEMIALLCTGLAALNYQRIHESYRFHRSQMEAQSRLLVADNAAALGKFAATMSHQLNSPLGALSSAVDTLHSISVRRGGADDARLQDLARELFHSARTSVAQIASAIRRMQRFTNLDRAEAHPVELGQLLRDVAAMAEPGVHDGVRIELQIDTLPSLTLKPQQMSAVFAKLLQNAVRVSPPGATVRLRARSVGDAVEIRVADEGPGLAPAALRTLFEPSFEVRNGKVVSGHWGLFTAREAVREQGGDISVQSEPGRGLEVTVTLPIEDAGQL